MANKEERLPIYLNMDISIEGLSGMPEGIKSSELLLNVLMNAMVVCGKAKNGFKIPEHERMYRVRTDLTNAIKLGESMRAKLEYDDFKFLMKCWNEHTPDPQGNELIIRVLEKLREAQSQHDRAEGKEGKLGDGEV